MSRESMLIALGVLAMLAPFSGVPLSVLSWFFLSIGLLVAVIGYSLRYERRKRLEKPRMNHEAQAPLLS